MNGLDSRIEYLMVSHLAQTLTEAERAELMSWVEASDLNRIVFDSYQGVWDLSQNGKVAQQIDVECDWLKLKHRIFTPKPKSLDFGWINRIAATIVLALLVGSLVYLLKGKTSDTIRLVADSGLKTVMLPDSSRVILNKNGVIEYSADFKDERRIVNLEGEAFFQVTHLGHSKFTVYTHLGEVVVLGTRFIVNAPDTNTKMEVKVESGKVLFSADDQSVLLTKGESAILEGGKLEKDHGLEPAELNWRSSKIVFKTASLQEIVAQLQASFSEFDSCRILSCDSTTKVTTTFENQSFDEVLKELSTHFGKKFTLENRILVISN